MTSHETKAYDIDALYRDAESHDDYRVAQATLDFTEAVCLEMERAGVTRAELARRLGTSPAYVSKILRGDTNFTLASMVKLARALGLGLDVRLGDGGEDGAVGDAARRATPARDGRVTTEAVATP